MFFRPQSPFIPVDQIWCGDESLFCQESNANNVLLTIGFNVMWHRDDDDHSEVRLTAKLGHVKSTRPFFLPELRSFS